MAAVTKYGRSTVNFNNLTAILFDMDNTLITTRKSDLKACNKVKKTTHFHCLSLVI